MLWRQLSMDKHIHARCGATNCKRWRRRLGKAIKHFDSNPATIHTRKLCWKQFENNTTNANSRQWQWRWWRWRWNNSRFLFHSVSNSTFFFISSFCYSFSSRCHCVCCSCLDRVSVLSEKNDNNNKRKKGKSAGKQTSTLSKATTKYEKKKQKSFHFVTDKRVEVIYLFTWYILTRLEHTAKVHVYVCVCVCVCLCGAMHHVGLLAECIEKIELSALEKEEAQTEIHTNGRTIGFTNRVHTIQ